LVTIDALKALLANARAANHKGGRWASKHGPQRFESSARTKPRRDTVFLTVSDSRIRAANRC